MLKGLRKEELPTQKCSALIGPDGKTTITPLVQASKVYGPAAKGTGPGGTVPLCQVVVTIKIPSFIGGGQANYNESPALRDPTANTIFARARVGARRSDARSAPERRARLGGAPRAGSSVGQSSGLIIRRSEVRILPGPSMPTRESQPDAYLDCCCGGPVSWE